MLNVAEMKLPKLLFFMSLYLLFAGCQEEPLKREGYGLVGSTLEIESSDLSRLEANLGSGFRVNGQFSYDNEIYKVKIHNSGKSTLNNPKRSYHLSFLKRKFKGHREYRLSAQNDDSSYLRSQMGFWAFRQMGLIVPEIEPISLYLNHEFLGIYFLIEPVDDTFFKRRGIQLASLYKARYGRLGHADLRSDSENDLSVGFAGKNNPADYFDLQNLVANFSLSKDLMNSSLTGLIDIDQTLDYHAVALSIDHWDGFANNYFLARPEGKAFFWTPWDLDKILSSQTSLQINLRPDNVVGDLLQSDSVARGVLYEKMREFYNTVVTPKKFARQLDLFKNRISEAWQRDPWRQEKNLDLESRKLLDNFSHRRDKILKIID